MASAFKHRSLPYLLLRARETFVAHFRPIPRERGITEQQWHVLRTPNGTSDMEPNQLADTRLILSPNLTRILAAMEQSEMTVRTKSSVDQRRQMVSLAPKSRQLLADVEPQVDAEHARIEAQSGRARLDALYAAIDELIQVMETHTPMGRFVDDE